MEIIDTTNWGGKPFDAYQIWEQREILSYQFKFDNPPIFITQIVNSIITNTDLYWGELELLDQAYIQKSLRQHGIDLLIYNLTIFPKSTSEIIPYTKNLNLKASLKEKLTKISIVREAGSVWFTLLLIAGLIYYKFDLFWWSILASCAIANTALMVIHDGWSHNSITPRYRIMGYILDLYGYLFTATTLRKMNQRKIMSSGHLIHHRYFYDIDKDNIYSGLNHNNWFQYIFRFGLTHNKNNEKFFTEQTDKGFIPVYNKMDKINKWMENNTESMLAVAHVVLFLVLGLKYYMYFVLIPLWYYGIFLYRFVEWLFWKSASDGRDLPYTFPLILGNAYHNLHHKYPDKIIVGPKPLRYINPQYWFVKIFFKRHAEFL
jgi:fatty acid desaturase